MEVSRQPDGGSERAAEPHSRAPAAPRRTKVRGHRGIYYRLAADGRRRYEITYRDSDGRQRWKTVDGGLQDAKADLEELRGRMRRGERVAPTRFTLTELVDLWLSQLEGQRRPRTIETGFRSSRARVFRTMGTSLSGLRLRDQRALRGTQGLAARELDTALVGRGWSGLPSERRDDVEAAGFTVWSRSGRYTASEECAQRSRAGFPRRLVHVVSAHRQEHETAG